MKNSSTAYLLWLVSCFGILGFHQFYLGKPLKGVLYIFTGGFLGIGAFIDLFTMSSLVDNYNTKVELKTIRTNALR